MDLAHEAWLLAYYLPPAEADLLHGCLHRSGGHAGAGGQLARSSSFTVMFYYINTEYAPCFILLCRTLQKIIKSPKYLLYFFLLHGVSLKKHACKQAEDNSICAFYSVFPHLPVLMAYLRVARQLIKTSSRVAGSSCSSQLLSCSSSLG